MQLTGASVGHYCHILQANLTNLHIKQQELIWFHKTKIWPMTDSSPGAPPAIF